MHLISKKQFSTYSTLFSNKQKRKTTLHLQIAWVFSKVFPNLSKSPGHWQLLVYHIKGKSYVSFDISGGIESASSHRHSVRMLFPQTFCPLYDKQVITIALGQLRINFTCMLTCVKLILNCPRAHAISYMYTYCESRHLHHAEVCSQ